MRAKLSKMLITRMSEGEGVGRREGPDAAEYRTADELFELMAKDHDLGTSENRSLSTRDLIILYKNIDVGTKLMSNTNVGQCKASNQHVETIVYKDERESDDSDVSEIYSNEDLQEVFSINSDRIDLINNLSSIQHPLCHKFGDIEFQTSNFTSEYDSRFLFKDPYIKQQLNNISFFPESTEFDTNLPTSLLDYICCKRLEDNYNFYMDNIIRYVQNTIEQLKRISNGDYLTDRAKEKWREVAKDLIIPSSESKVLATSVSIPIHVMGKVDGHRSTWDDIVHSEVDVRSLSKILEKKIVIEVPKLICGSYRLFSERCPNNLIISCKKDLEANNGQDNGESRVDVVFQLKPSGSGHVISNINSIMILQKIPSQATPEPNENQPSETGYRNYKENVEEHTKIIEIDEQEQKEDDKEHTQVLINADNKCENMNVTVNMAVLDTNDCSLIPSNCYVGSCQSSITDKSLLKKMSTKTLKAETDFTVMSPDELRTAIRRLNMQTPVLEESEESNISKKKSPTRVRIKSPYENQSYSIEEKKRKKLLEIRDKREKKKIALTENCKVTKHKYGKSPITAQPSSSVTKLSITNKSFYNSIYGENVSQDGGSSKKSRTSQKIDIFEQDLRKIKCQNDIFESSITALDRRFLDDGNTETFIQMQQKLDTETYSTRISGISNDSTDFLSRLMRSTGTESNSDDSSHDQNPKQDKGNVEYRDRYLNEMADVGTCQSSCILVPANTPKESPVKSQDGSRKTTTSLECRKSIDKIYNLLKKIDKRDCVLNNTEELNLDGGHSSTIQVSDSGTSVKHHVVSSNPSTFSFEKNNSLSRQTYRDKNKKEVPATVVPKVIISTKLQTSKIDTECNKIDRKRTNVSPKVTDNPLKAISQLLHEFNNVQKTRNKTHKKDDHILADGKSVSRQGSSKKSRPEPTNKINELVGPLKSMSNKERRFRAALPQDPPKLSQPLKYSDEKHVRPARRNLSDIIDEAKEARGEAVRGPSKPYSRLYSLAQPKKTYVQAHIDEYQNKYGKNVTTNRLNRVTVSAPLVEKNLVNTNNSRNRRRGPEISIVSPIKTGISSVPPIERITKPRRSASNSPARKQGLQPTTESSFIQMAAPKSPDLKNKMVAVESYVKSHYGHIPIDDSELKGHEVHKSRVPLIPNDIELASLSSPNAGESTALGNQLHYMVDTMVNTNAPQLSVLTECQECKLSDGLEKLSTESLLKIDEHKSESDYPVDVFEDKNILTAVASIPKDRLQEVKVTDENIDTVNTYNVQAFNSATELRKLENALYKQMSVGSFAKRLRIKNLTLTPKQSLQQVIVVQSGDGSLLVKSSLSQSLRTDSKTDSSTALKPLAALSNTHINWGFTNIPLQVATIGYAFPTYQSIQRNSFGTSCMQSFMEKPLKEDIGKDACKSHKTSQCFKGIHNEPSLEQATQANIEVSITSTSSMGIESSKVQNEKITKESGMAKSEKVQPISTICERIRLFTENIEKTQSITEGFQTLQPITAKPDSILTMTDKCKRIQTEKEKCDIVQSVTEQCERDQPLTKQIQKVKLPIEQHRRINQATDQFDETEYIAASKITLNDAKDINECGAEENSSEIIDHSTSLDILMGLLNEIRKITGEVINKNTDNEVDHNNQCKELEILLNNAATHESSIDNNFGNFVSVSSFDKLNRLDSTASACSINILKEIDGTVVNNESKIKILKDFNMDYYKPRNMDKEVSADIEKQYVNTLTDTPSCFFPLTINHSTNIRDSVTDILSKPSTLSIYSFAKYETLNSNAIVASEQSTSEKTNLMSCVDNETEADYFNIVDDKKDENIYPNRDTLKPKSESMASRLPAALVNNRYKLASKIVINSSCGAINSNLDPLMKIKRDLLVTVYSILVFTVFAALSFPKIFFHVDF